MIGTVVVELGQVVSAPYCGMILGQLGATVVKVESPRGGDMFRGGGTEPNPAFVALNRGKRSVAVDLKTDAGRADLLRLVTRADVLVENFRPGVLGSLGLGYEQLSSANPRLVHCSITGFGEDGPYADRPGYDPLAQALSGLWSQFTDMERPEAVGPPTCDLLAGMYAAHHVLAALVERQTTGRGTSIAVSLLSSALSFQSIALERLRADGRTPDRLTRARHSQTYPLLTQDGPVVVHLSSRDDYWRGLIRALDAPDLAEDPRFIDAAARRRSYDALCEELQARTSGRRRGDYVATLHHHGVPAAPLLDLAEAFEDDQVQAVMAVSGDDDGPSRRVPVLGRDRWAGVAQSGGPPTLGEHTAELLSARGPA